jgi:flagellar basal-body rod modification protein FlgD
VQVNNIASSPTPAATTSASSTSRSTSSSANTSLADPNLFITLLTAQLKAQDPTNPMSAQDMVTQLTQVSSLQQLISINQTLTNLSAGTLPATTPITNQTGATQ